MKPHGGSQTDQSVWPMHKWQRHPWIKKFTSWMGHFIFR